MAKKSRLIVLAACAFAMGLGFSVTAVAGGDGEGECLYDCWLEYRQCKTSGLFTPEQCLASYNTCKVNCY